MIINPIFRGILKPIISAAVGSAYDSFEEYTTGSNLNNLNGSIDYTGSNGAIFDGPYTDRMSYLGIQTIDTIESYTTGSLVNGLNAGLGWSGPYVDMTGSYGTITLDTMETYTVGDMVNGLNSGSGWSSAYVDR